MLIKEITSKNNVYQLLTTLSVTENEGSIMQISIISYDIEKQQSKKKVKLRMPKYCDFIYKNRFRFTGGTENRAHLKDKTEGIEELFYEFIYEYYDNLKNELELKLYEQFQSEVRSDIQNKILNLYKNINTLDKENIQLKEILSSFYKSNKIYNEIETIKEEVENIRKLEDIERIKKGEKNETDKNWK
ncbi:hypothetical protein JK211_14505 [Tatumella sp. JGM130]|uniref:hypothetical protein n=1 Tax=Tatumella sp. JGM130 TaxID=2799797 RepID=UPI001BAF13B8|nr:hypothetical protein [Tatumella sp. JGM130]MBS0895226.1 hypothetical protein [Tatumella sp. JGM130]